MLGSNISLNYKARVGRLKRHHTSTDLGTGGVTFGEVMKTEGGGEELPATA